MVYVLKIHLNVKHSTDRNNRLKTGKHLGRFEWSSQNNLGRKMWILKIYWGTVLRDVLIRLMLELDLSFTFSDIIVSMSYFKEKISYAFMLLVWIMIYHLENEVTVKLHMVENAGYLESQSLTEIYSAISPSGFKSELLTLTSEVHLLCASVFSCVQGG